jgi:hypothetical protein
MPDPILEKLKKEFGVGKRVTLIKQSSSQTWIKIGRAHV